VKNRWQESVPSAVGVRVRLLIIWAQIFIWAVHGEHNPQIPWRARPKTFETCIKPARSIAGLDAAIDELTDAVTLVDYTAGSEIIQQDPSDWSSNTHRLLAHPASGARTITTCLLMASWWAASTSHGLVSNRSRRLPRDDVRWIEKVFKAEQQTIEETSCCSRKARGADQSCKMMRPAGGPRALPSAWSLQARAVDRPWSAPMPTAVSRRRLSVWCSSVGARLHLAALDNSGSCMPPRRSRMSSAWLRTAKVARVTQESLRAAIAVVPQDISLFHRSIMENIRYGDPLIRSRQRPARRLSLCKKIGSSISCLGEITSY